MSTPSCKGVWVVRVLFQEESCWLVHTLAVLGGGSNPPKALLEGLASAWHWKGILQEMRHSEICGKIIL